MPRGSNQFSYSSQRVSGGIQILRLIPSKCMFLFLNCFFFSLFDLSEKVISGSVFCQLILGVLFISTTNLELEMVGFISLGIVKKESTHQYPFLQFRQLDQ